MPTLATYIAFLDNAEEAFAHYHDVFGGDLQVMKYGDFPPMEGMPFEPDPNSAAHIQLDLPGGRICGADAVPGEDYAVRDTIYSMLYTFETVDEAKDRIQKLVDAGGTVQMPFEPAPWGGHYGQVFDKFGIMWSFDVPDEDA